MAKQNSNPNPNSRNTAHMPPPHEEQDFNLTETRPSLGGGRISSSDRGGTAFDLVEQMDYLYVRVVKARALPGSPDSFVEVKLGGLRAATRNFENTSSPEWNQVFSVLKDRIQSPVTEVLVKSKPKNGGDGFIGRILVDAIDVPRRVPPDSPLAPEWYRLENSKGERVAGELMLSIWMGTQADEAFSEAWHLDTTAVNGDGVSSIRSKVYLSPRLWYLRVNVIEAQELQLGDKNRHQPEIIVRAQLGNLISRTKISQSKNLNPLWNEDLMFTVAEPFDEQLILFVEETIGNNNKREELGHCVVSLQGVERRLDFKAPMSRWYNLQKHTVLENGQRSTKGLNSRLHLRMSLDGGYHVLDELTHYSSDLRPTARQLWKPAIGVLELGILNAQNLAAMKTRDGRGYTDAYCVAKYGQKWIRTRTILNTFDPKWNEQYTWEVFDPCTVITIGVFDNSQLQGQNGNKKDSRIGKVRIRLSTLETNRVYTHMYPLIVLSPTGVKKMGEIQLAVRFSCASLLNMLSMYGRPLLPSLHYLHPLSCHNIEILRHQATQIVSARVSRAEPPLRKEVVEFMLDVGSNVWSVRRSKANHFRVARIMSGLAKLSRWFDRICAWYSPFTTVLVHILFLAFVCFPWMIPSTVFLYLFLIGMLKYRWRPRHPPHMDVKLSQADTAQNDELDEEFDSFPTSLKQVEVLKMRYDRLRAIASRVQTVLGDLATQGERLNNLLSWRDPRATALFLMFCLVACVVLYVAPPKAVFVVGGFYTMRHPSFRDRMPLPPVNFLRRLPARTDGLL
ncbi:Calcium-dependent lipid-binding (CaLB domain) plant phosphoribosyltransferase family protein [Striga hermonthica]|uniref:Calcium-dependent lipid-binding (CaLB domain) plant phosphoribosyltransferase family protein n=1 Tax=Striga hermonthica TaxID=68872 RepID=A0A9N7REI4_STRHE|nr:Calcium-dependent lipid-binding (CaLB domain) plant phosphoribosyltransferase family protein [Striga hermonthica]